MLNTIPRDTHRHRQKHADTKTHQHRHIDTQTYTDTHKHTDIQIYTDRDTQIRWGLLSCGAKLMLWR